VLLGGQGRLTRLTATDNAILFQDLFASFLAGRADSQMIDFWAQNEYQNLRNKQQRLNFEREKCIRKRLT